MPRAMTRTRSVRALALFIAVAVLGVATTTLLGNQAEAAITTPFGTRFQANVNGSIILRGNTSMLCPAAAAGCTGGQAGTDSGPESLNNNGYVMEYADADGDGGTTTFNDSTASVTVPPNSTVLFAGLYWSADTSAGNTGSAAPSVADRDKVLFRTSSSGAWQNITASRVFTEGALTAYQGFADVTSLVAGAGSSTYGVANIQAGTGKDRYAGWSLAIAYQNAAEDMHSLRIYDGFGVVSSASTSVQITASGFQTPQNGTVNAKVGTVVYEGDLGKTGDVLQIGPPTASVSDSANPVDNFFNSTVSDGGTLINSGRSPGYRNLMGVDIDQFDATGKLGHGQTSATLTLTTGGETFYPGVVTFTTDLYAPKLVATTTGTDRNGGTLVPGDEIEYRIAVKNEGDAKSVQTMLSDAVPTHTTYVPDSLKIETAPVSDADDGVDTGKFDSATKTATWGIGPGGEIAAGGTTYVTFRVKVDLDAPAGYPITNLGNLDYQADYTNMAITGVSGSSTMTVQQPTADLAAGLTVTPAYVQRTAVPAAVGYQLTVTNNGTDLEPQPVAKLTLPTGVTAGSLPAGCTVAGQVVTCRPAALGPNAQATITIPATATASADPDVVATLTVSGSGLDANSANDTATATLRVNSAPVAATDTAGTPTDTAVTFDVRGNDTDADDNRATLTVSIVTPPAHGAAVVLADGRIRYTPTAKYAGDDTLTYRVSDGFGGTDTATVTITTQNAAPVANDDVVATAADTRINILVKANDTDANDDPLQVVSITQPQSGAGTATLSGDVVTYVPAAGFVGRAAFTYTVKDGRGGPGGQTVGRIFVDVANAEPIAATDRVDVAYRGSSTIDAVANDTDANTGDTLVITHVDAPAHGTATLVGGKIAYQAPNVFSGDDTLTYTLSDGNGGTATGTVIVTVANALPVAADESVHTATNTAIRLPVHTDSTDPNNDPLKATGTTAPQHGTVVRNADGSLTYTPATGFAGNDTFDYTIADGRGGTDVGTVTVVVTNGVPTAGPDSVTVPANTVAVIDVLADDNDPNNDPLTVTVDVQPQHGTVSVGANGKVTYTPATGYRGADSFHYTIDDGHLGTAGATVTVGVVNSAPVARPDAISTDTDTMVVIPVLGNDTDPNGDTLSTTSATTPGHGTVVRNAGGTLTYTPAEGFFGTDSFTYSIIDPDGLTDSAIVTVTVRDAPPIAVDDRFVVRPGTSTTLALLANDRDPNTGQALRVASVGQGAKGTVALAADGTVTYQPNTGATGTDTFEYVLTDDLGLTDTAGVTVVIDATPVTTADTATAKAATAVDIPVVTNDTDAEGGALTLTGVSKPAHGTATIVDGRIRYTPAGGFTGTDTFTYVVTDPAGNTATGTVTVHVSDAPPVAVPDVTAVLAGQSVTVPVLANDTDANPGQTLTVTDPGKPAHGTAVLVDGKIKYTPAAGFTGTDTFTYTISDGHDGVAQATVTVTVSGGQAVAVPDSRTTPYRQSVTIPVLTNDLDPGATLTLISVGSPDHGTVVINGRSVVYTPADGFSGVATFTYTATDSAGGTVTGTVTVTVGTPPVVPDKSATAKPGKAVTIALPTIDENGKKVTVRSIGKPKHGTATLNADGTVTYLAAKGFTGTDSLTYTVVDEDGNVAMASITIRVAGTNTPPVAKRDSETVDAGGSIVIKPLTNDSDVNGDTLTVTRISKPRHGQAVLNADGTVTYAPYDSYQGGKDSFTYTISDGHGGTATSTITITVNAAAGSGSDNLPRTGLNVMSVAGAGLLALVVGGGFLLFGNATGTLLPAGIERHGPGRHRPGRHRQ